MNLIKLPFKLIVFIIIFPMILSVSLVNVFAESSTDVSNPVSFTVVNKGDTFAIPISLQNLPQNGICGCEISLIWDRNVFEYVSFDSTGTIAKSPTTDFGYNAPTTGSYNFKMFYADYSINGSSHITSPGLLFTVTLRFKTSAIYGSNIIKVTMPNSGTFSTYTVLPHSKDQNNPDDVAIVPITEDFAPNFKNDTITVTMPSGWSTEAPAVSKTALVSAVTNATTLLNSKTVGTLVGNVPQAAYDAFQAVITTAGGINADTNAIQSQIDAQVTALATATITFNNAIITDVNKTALVSAISDATTLLNSKTVGTSVGNVPQAAHDAFQGAITTAGGVNTNTNATQAQIDAQVTALATAVTAFNNAIITSTVVNKTNLQTAIANATAQLNSKIVGYANGNVSQTTKDNFQTAISDAMAVDSNVNATQAQVNAQIAALNTATTVFNNAVLIVLANKTALITAITNATTLINSKTAGTVPGNVPQDAKNAFQTAITAASDVNKDANATQAQVDAQVSALATATTIFNNAIIVAKVYLKLDDIVVEKGVLSPKYDKEETQYNIILSGDVDKLVITPKVSSDAANTRIEIDGKEYMPNQPIVLPLHSELNRVSIIVRKVNYYGINVYTLFVGRDTQTVTQTTTLDDIKTHWAYDQITALVKKGYVSGYPDKTFKPDNNITRCEAVVLMAKALEYDVSLVGTSSFSDASQIPTWALPYVNAALKNGLIKGYEDGSFRPQNLITRAEALALIIMAIKDTNVKKLVYFSDDYDIKDWSRDYFMVAYQKNIIKGYSDNSIKPNKPITRAEMCTILNNSLPMFRKN